MLHRDIVMTTAKRAAEVVKASGAMERIEQDGYTRINPFHIADSEGVTVMLRPMEKLLGAFIRQEVPGILVNAQRPAGLIHMTCAHELGHYFMDHESAADDTIEYGDRADRKEQEADWFSYHLLTHRPLLSTLCKRKNWDRKSIQQPTVLYQMALRLGISYTALAWSLRRHGILDTRTVRRLLKTQPADIKRSLMGNKLQDATKDVWLLDEHDRNSILEPRVDDYMLVRLKSHASAGYLWLTDSIDQVAEEDFKLAPIASSASDHDSLKFGSDATMDYLISGGRRAAESITPLYLCERKPWLPHQEPHATFSTKAHFESLEVGLTREAKIALLQEDHEK